MFLQPLGWFSWSTFLCLSHGLKGSRLGTKGVQWGSIWKHMEAYGNNFGGQSLTTSNPSGGNSQRLRMFHYVPLRSIARCQVGFKQQLVTRTGDPKHRGFKSHFAWYLCRWRSDTARTDGKHRSAAAMAPAQGPQDLKATGSHDQVTYGHQIPGFKNRPSANRFPAVPCSSLICWRFARVDPRLSWMCTLQLGSTAEATATGPNWAWASSATGHDGHICPGLETLEIWYGILVDVLWCGQWKLILPLLKSKLLGVPCLICLVLNRLRSDLFRPFGMIQQKRLWRRTGS